MDDYAAPFRGKKITVMGLGLLGRGVGDAEFLAKCGANVLVTDSKSAAELAESVEKLKSYPNITFKLGGHDEKDFTSCDMVIKAAGVPLDSPYIAAARKAGVPVAMSTAMFAKYASQMGVTVVGVTGTRGKSTVAFMIHHVLKKAGKRTIIGGNIRGISTLAMLPEIQSGDVAVLEIDSWQLQGFRDTHFSPHVAILTNLIQDHLNYYTTMDAYFSDKANIFRYQKPDDVLIVGQSVMARALNEHSPAKPHVPAPLPADWTLAIPGEHNRENASFAVAALHALRIDDATIRAGLESFEGVEGRLQFLGEVNGVKIYNDNNATTPEATIAALRAFGEHKNVILIAGGADKQLDMSALIAEIKKGCKKIMLLAGTGTEQLKKEFPEAQVFDALKPALEAAVAASSAGDIILFSPAFASFGMFKNEYDRNDQFLTLVKEVSGHGAG